jgi:hypothetical protein
MLWFVYALAAQDLINERERQIAALHREREARRALAIHSDLPAFGRIRRPLARVATAISSGASRAAVALDPELSGG